MSFENDARNISDPSACQKYTRKLQAKVLRNRKEPAATAHAWRRTDAGTDERCFSREQLCVECEVAHTPLPIYVVLFFAFPGAGSAADRNVGRGKTLAPACEAFSVPGAGAIRGLWPGHRNRR